MTTDFQTIFNQTQNQIDILNSEITILQSKLKASNQEYINEIVNAKEKGSQESQKSEIFAVDYVSKIIQDDSQISLESVYTTMKKLLKIES